MSIPGSVNPLFLGAAGQATGEGGYLIERSLRFNSADSAYLSRTPASAGNRKTWTWAGWVKKCSSKNHILLSCVGAQSDTQALFIDFLSDDTLRVLGWSTVWRKTTQVFRDPSAWYHIVVTFDSTQATAANRIKIYVNGSEVTTFSTNNAPAQNTDFGINQAALHEIGRYTVSSVGYDYFDGYLADIHFIDGQALDPTSFGEFDATTGVWMPKAYTGTYGTNGFHLDFADNSSNTATTLGKDTSGNGNNWTPNNLSVTAGAGNDSLVDVPTNGAQTDTGAGGEVRGNYATWNSINTTSNVSISNGNLDLASSAQHGQTLSTVGISSGKWYWEITKSSSGNPFTAGLGLMQQGFKTSSTFVGTGAGRNFIYLQSGIVYVYDGASSPFFSNSSLVNNIGTWIFAYDADAAKMWFGKDGVWYDTAGASITGPSSGLNAPFTSFNTADSYFPFFNSDRTAGTWVANFGQRPFAYTAPSGFKALNTANLPAPIVTKPNTVFDVALDTGANILTAAQNKLSTGTDLLWIKDRANANNHQLIDTVRGGTATLQSNTTAAETTYSAPSGSSVAWCWDAGSSTVTNTQGSISSQVRANASAGFSVVTYTGNLSGNGNATVGHGLGVAPQLVITKARSATSRWAVQMPTALSANHYLELNSTDAQSSWGAQTRANPTSTVFDTIYAGGVNESGVTYVAYCFAPVAGYSSFGSYTGNGSADGPFVYTGFRPRWILIKQATSSGDGWYIYDAQRIGYNPTNLYLWANGSNEEQTSGNFDLLSNGFKLRTTASALNYTGYTYIYAAFAEHPFQYSRAR